MLTNIKEKKHTAKRFIYISLFCSIIFYIFCTVVLNIYTNKIKHQSIENAETTLEMVSSQNVSAANYRLEKQFNTLIRISTIIENNFIDNTPEEIVNHLKTTSFITDFYNLGITDSNGVCRTTLDEQFWLGDKDYITKAFENQITFTNSELSEDHKLNINIIALPVSESENVKYVLTGVQTSSKFLDTYNVASFNNTGRSLIVDSSGHMIATSLTDQSIDWNIFDKIDTYPEVMQQLVEGIKSNTPGFINYQYNQLDYMAYYQPLSIENLYLVSYVPYTSIFSTSDQIIATSTYVMRLVSIVVLMLVTIIVLISLYYNKKIKEYLFIDPITKSYNYTYFKSHYTDQEFSTYSKSALCVLDIDQFKLINTRYSNEIGNDVLSKIYSIFLETLPTDDIYRDRNDVFVIMLRHITLNDIPVKLNKFKNAIDKAIIEGSIPHLHIAIGVSICSNYESIDAAYTDAIIAKSKIKGNLKEFFAISNSEDRITIEQSKKVEEDFRNALNNNEFKIWLQPKYDITTNTIVGAEALVRWIKNDETIIPPYAFIPVYERNGQIIELDIEIIRLTCKFIQQCKINKIKTVPISINLSRMQVDNPLFEHQLKTIIEQYEINTDDITFEITESALAYQNSRINKLFNSIQTLGFKIDMDDFGTGASGMDTLSQFDFNTVKIDKSFIDHIGEPKQEEILKSIIQLCHNLNLSIVAEGVEKVSQVKFLRQNNCNIVQGYLYSPPVSQDIFTKLLQKNI